ncbi:DUF4268 domain-containing protein [bacterium]|nr:DUF4268 domain-containing protein [bacterium]
MTETITPAEVFKSREKFSKAMENSSNNTFIASILDDYPIKIGKVVMTITDLTQNYETFGNLISDDLVCNLPEPPYIVWIVANEKESILKQMAAINKYSTSGFGIFIFKAFLNEDKIEFKCLLKPPVPKKTTRVVNQNAPAKLLQKEYWDKYFEVCDELQSQMQINPKAQHFQYIPMKKRGVQIMQTINTVNNYVATEIFINNDKEIFNKLLEHKNEIEEVLGYLDWQELEGKKSSRIRKTLNYNADSEKALKQTITTHIKTAEEFKATFCKYL